MKKQTALLKEATEQVVPKGKAVREHWVATGDRVALAHRLGWVSSISVGTEDTVLDAAAVGITEAGVLGNLGRIQVAWDTGEVTMVWPYKLSYLKYIAEEER
jgi:hypothetical protein